MDIPIVINSFNRLTYLRRVVDFFAKRNHKLIILDNNSTYEPLLDWYKTSGIEVLYLKENYGHKAIWVNDFHKKLGEYYVYTDPDILPTEAFPNNWMEYFVELLKKNYKDDPVKIGCALMYKDIPAHYELRNWVVCAESKFWNEQIDPNIYRAPVDTTLALYKQTRKLPRARRALRVAGDYIARHLPWYEDTSKLTEEQTYYLQSIKSDPSWSWNEKMWKEKGIRRG